MSKQGLADLSGGFDRVKAAGAQLDAQAEPRLRQALGMDDAPSPLTWPARCPAFISSTRKHPAS